MRFISPCYGPDKGKIVAVPHELEDREQGDVWFPGIERAGASFTGEALIEHNRGSVDLMTGQLVSSGIPLEEARAHAITAARRADGEHGGNLPYTRFHEEG